MTVVLLKDLLSEHKWGNYDIELGKVNNILMIKNLKKYWIATSSFRGDIGKVQKGEIFSHEGTSKENSEYVFMYLANPYQEFYTDVRKDELKKLFRPVDETKDIRSLELLNKWGLIEYGNGYWILSVSLDKRHDTFKTAITSGLKGVKEYKAKSPKLALKKAGYHTGRMDEVGKDMWFTKMYADWGFIVSIKKPTEYSVQKLVNMVKKADTIKESTTIKLKDLIPGT